ncbi:PadR family transcriptional regulator [Nonomuraea aurantiaca]|jgi:DNA-binding PadR family transcriptional regulator|uniref:PadR family transcriptional regulator n=1 Tax=Nonomuraea aurantiaca TaxID=2878562 RepID=UPI001CDA3904|nr:PadR family transcriptional regulator [Nonomuraea aurantiaca]MCA2226262.1 PadR family transcriptional regulator [Nonomuraea aurantiaca]
MARRTDPLGWGNPPLLILGSLADGPKHGYAIIKDVREQAGVTLGPGTLYGALSRLEERGLVEALPGEERRRPYRITAAGAAELGEKLAEMSRFATVGLRRLSMGVAR